MVKYFALGYLMIMAKNILYQSTRGDKIHLNFKEVIFEGLAPDGGLYVPSYWPVIDHEEMTNFSNLSYQEIALYLIKLFTDTSINDEELKNIINESYSKFSSEDITPLVKLNDREYLLELFHGPTYAFKDVAMQFIGNIMDFYLNKDGGFVNILGATSGDTGAAAIEGFDSVTNCNIFILHPYNRISEVQKKFMTTNYSKNVYNVAIKGTFDDCQNIIKDIFSDLHFKRSNHLTAVNSINWIRIMCQIVYYFYSMSRLNAKDKKILYSVPTGNFGDILAGYISIKMGLNIGKLNIATNENDILTRTINSGEHLMRDVQTTSSPSIDIQISSNFERLLFDLTKDHDFVKNKMDDLAKSGCYTISDKVLDQMKKTFCSHSVSESEVNEIINSYNKKYGLIVDPHTAVGLGSAAQYSADYDICVSLATAHPAKFKDTVSKIIGNENFVPDKVKNMMTLEDKLVILDNDVKVVKKFIKENI